MKPAIQTAFVTGSTGLLGNNLVHLLLQQGVKVRGLARSRRKALAQFGTLDGLEIVEGDMEDVAGFADGLKGCDALFHTAAYFRDSYGGGKHWDALKRINVDGTAALLDAAYDAGIRRFVHTSSIAVVNGPRGAVIDETMKRRQDDADDYYRSKILSDEAVQRFLATHPDTFGVFVMPGWMHGPGDMGPTAAGQFTVDFLKKALPGVPPSTVSFVDARDVAQIILAAFEKGRRGEHYLAAGRHMHMREVMQSYEAVTGVKAPRRSLPAALLWTIAYLQELNARLTGKPALLSVATVRTMRDEFDRSRFSPDKTQRELGLGFRPVTETIRDEVAWLRARGLA
jgi:nucleoside-diphosphate-sugar epimerase